MGDFEQKPNSGVAFRNDYKDIENKPDFKGKGNFNGQVFEFAMWERTSPKGQYFSIAFQEPYIKREEKVVTDISKTPQEGSPINLDDIPF